MNDQTTENKLCVSCGQPIQDGDSFLCATCREINGPVSSSQSPDVPPPGPNITKHSHLKFIVPVVVFVAASLTLGFVLLGQQNTVSKVRNDLASTQSSTSQDQSSTSSQQGVLASVQTQIDQTRKDITDSANSLLVKQGQLSALQTQLSNLTSDSYGFGLSDPTYQQVLNFIAKDTIDANNYDLMNYNCWDFTVDTVVNALKQHIRCGLVSISYIGPGHAIVAFNTTDAGIVYFDPQDDVRVILKTGSRFYQCLVAPPGYHYNPPSYDDTILDFAVIWP